MSVSAPTAERSLTLPDWRTAVKKRIKRPRKPDPREAIWLGLTIWSIASAVLHFMQHKYRFAAQDAIFAGFDWKIYLSIRSTDQFETLRWICFMLAFSVSCLFW